MKKLAKGYILIILGVILISAFFIIFKVAEHSSSKPERYNLAYLESETPKLIQDHMDKGSYFSELLSCHVFAQDNQVFAFF